MGRLHLDVLYMYIKLRPMYLYMGNYSGPTHIIYVYIACVFGLNNIYLSTICQQLQNYVKAFCVCVWSGCNYHGGECSNTTKKHIYHVDIETKCQKYFNQSVWYFL